MTKQEALEDIVENGIRLGAGDYVTVEALEIAADALRSQIEGGTKTETWRNKFLSKFTRME